LNRVAPSSKPRSQVRDHHSVPRKFFVASPGAGGQDQDSMGIYCRCNLATAKPHLIVDSRLDQRRSPQVSPGTTPSGGEGSCSPAWLELLMMPQELLDADPPLAVDGPLHLINPGKNTPRTFTTLSYARRNSRLIFWVSDRQDHPCLVRAPPPWLTTPPWSWLG
jgi:hypothetical protein